jgi:eukaryotic-like serine/threonine-protein kinase
MPARGVQARICVSLLPTVVVSLKKLGRYDLIRVLGKGAMGIVYEGRDPNLDRRVAIKTVKVENLSEEAAAEYEARFRTEARSAARLQHPNIVSVYDSDRDGDIAFLVMEYIQGDDLKYHLDKGIRYSLEQSLKMIRDLLSALDYAHKQGIVHRDVKPANLLIEPGGRVKLTDFGVARIQDSGEATRTQGSMVGTLKYMSPEQVQGQKIDSRADLFSVGVVLYQLLTDKRPFDGDNDFSIIHQIIGHTPAPPSSFNARLPPAIDAVVARALAKDREQRFASARDFASALQSAMRRAEDATVVPPADPSRKIEAARTDSRGHPSVPGGASGTGGSTVTQELELVYWKDIKDSTEPDELEGFLVKFPDGIYADLARKRLRKLSGGSSPDQTVLSGSAMAGREQDLEATRLRTGSTPLSVAATATAATVTATAPGRDFLRTVVEERATPEPEPVHEAPTASPAAPEPVAPLVAATASAEPVAPNRKKPPVAIFAGLAAVAVAGIAAFMLMGRGAPEVPVAGASSPASAAAPQAPVATPVATPVALTPAAAPAAHASAASAIHTSAAASASHATAAAAKASAARRAAVAVKPKPAASVAVAIEPPRAAPPAPAPRREEARVASTPAAAAGPSPVDACKEKIFITREFCLQENCPKPGQRNHPLCVEWRRDVELRDAARNRPIN